MGTLGAIIAATAAAAGVVGSVVGGWSLTATAANNDNIWATLPIEVQDAIRNAGLAPGR